jgi:type II secretory pathway pseudopilin PulG
MSRLAREEAGFTLTELLLVSVLMIVVLGASLTSLNSFQTNAARNERQNDAQQEARRAIDQLARELRNLASPVDYDPAAVKRKEPQDLIVQSVGAFRPAGSLNMRNTQYVRYCLASEGLVYRQSLGWSAAVAPPVPAGGECPASGWGTTQVAASDVVNGTRALFTYNGTSLETVTEITASLFVDIDPESRPKETTIGTTVFLRNQNRVPVARFSAAPTAGGAILLNGAESEDPEERALTYDWYDPAAVPPRVGGGIVFTYTPETPGPHDVYLVVTDPGELTNQAPTQTVCVPGSGVVC